MRINWKDPVPVTLVSGTEGFYVRQFIRTAMQGCMKSGRQVHILDGGQKAIEEIEDIQGAMALFEEPVLVVVYGVAEIVDGLLKVIPTLEGIPLLLVHEGEVEKVSKLIEVAQVKYDFPSPPVYKATETATGFIMKELGKRGMEIKEELAGAWVEKAGTDLGVLWFEMLKLHMYVGIGYKGQVGPEHIKAVMLTFREMDPSGIVDAVGKASVPKVLKAMDQVKQNANADPTMVVNTWLGNQAFKWLHAAALNEQGAKPSEAASRIGLNPYVYERHVLPVAQRWGEKNLRHLLRRISQVESAITSGRVDPWIFLETSLIGVCKKVQGTRGTIGGLAGSVAP